MLRSTSRSRRHANHGSARLLQAVAGQIASTTIALAGLLVACSGAAGQACPNPPPPGTLLVPNDIRCGSLAEGTAHHSIDSLGSNVNRPGGYVTVGQRNIPGTGLAGLHVVRWNVNGTIAASKLFSIAGSPSETIVGTSVDANANCELLVAGSIYNTATGVDSNFVVRLTPTLVPIGAGVRLTGPVERGTAVQADWLADGTVIILDRLNPGSNVVDSRITRMPSVLGAPIWSNRYHSFMVGTASQFIARDIEQDSDPLSPRDIFVCGSMNWPLLPTTRTLPMLMSVNLATGAVLQVRAYDITTTSPWISGAFSAIKFNPTVGPLLHNILVAGWATRPGATQFDPPITVPQLAMINRATLATTWDKLYTGLGGWIPATSAIGIGPSSLSAAALTVAGRANCASCGLGGDSGFTLNARQDTGALNWARRHGTPQVGVSSYEFADISPGFTRWTIGTYSDLSPFGSGGSLLWKGEGACPTIVPTPESAITPPALGTGEVVQTGDTAFPAIMLQEWATSTLCTTICRACYVNCDQSTVAPLLNINDFQCFLNAFASGDDYANCDESTVAPVLNINDFSCFLNAYATGCT